MTYITITPTTLTYTTINSSVDLAIKLMKQHPQVKEFLHTSNLGTEYLNISFSHGEDISITINK